MQRTPRFLLFGLLLVSPAWAGKVERRDATKVVTLTTGFESTDLQQIAADMVESFLASPIVGDGRPIVLMGQVKNRTAEHLDTKSITDKIRTALSRSGKVRFVAGDLRRQIHSETDYQNGGRVDPGTAAGTGNAIGARYVIGGAISSIETKGRRRKEVYYKMTLNLVDLETQVIEWADETEIRKQATRKVFGR